MYGVESDSNCNETAKLQQHLALLREEYQKLQNQKNDLERKYTVLSATTGNVTENSFVSRLLKVVSSLYDNTKYSDLSIQLPNRTIPAHKIILTARNSTWGGVNLTDVDSLDWTHTSLDIGSALIKWIYTDQVDFSKGEDFTLELIKIANEYRLEDLISKCENALMVLVNKKNCVRFYTTADEINAETLKQHCSSLISTHWEDFTSEDFSHMSAPLLFHMFKNKTEYPLHSAVRLRREDVVFLCLVENNSQKDMYTYCLPRISPEMKDVLHISARKFIASLGTNLGKCNLFFEDQNLVRLLVIVGSKF